MTASSSAAVPGPVTGSPEAYVLGVGMTSFGRHVDRSLSDLAVEAVQTALDDAGVEPSAVRAVMVGNAVQGAMDGQHGIRGQLMLRGLPLGTIPVVNVENACASASFALHLAVAYVGSGMADVVMALGAEKLVSRDRQRSLDAFSGSWDETRREETLAGLAVFGQATRYRRGSRSWPPTASSWTFTPPSPASTWPAGAARSGSSRRSAPRTTGTRCTTRTPSTGGRSRSRRCWPAGSSPGR